MISDKWRREVARRLRSMKPEETTAPFGKPVLMHIFRSVFPNQMFLTNWILRLPYQLADLIDRPVTHNIAEHPGFKCKLCGDEWPLDIGFDYCPRCGAEVVEGD